MLDSRSFNIAWVQNIWFYDYLFLKFIRSLFGFRFTYCMCVFVMDVSMHVCLRTLNSTCGYLFAYHEVYIHVCTCDSKHT